MSKNLTFCNGCKGIYAGLEATSPCPKCGAALVETNIDGSRWGTMTVDEKNSLTATIIGRYGKPASTAITGNGNKSADEARAVMRQLNTNAIPGSQDAEEIRHYIQNIAHDVHFLYVLALIGVIGGVTLGLLSALAAFIK